jgi:uncharacterized protein (DUF924 family)
MPQRTRLRNRATARGLDLEISPRLRCFFYLPFTHSERITDQERGVALIAERLGKHTKDYVYALMHRDVIAKFGRSPGRNVALGRQSTPEELEFLSTDPPF